MEFPKMRRFKQELSPAERETILQNGTSGVLALGGEEYPYAVPMSYVWTEGKVYFHCARTGEKLRRLEKDGKVSFCVIGQDSVVPEEYTTYYKSVIVFGELSVVTDPPERRRAAEKLGRKYAPQGTEEALSEELRRFDSAMTILRLTPVHITGKQAKELIPAGK